MFNYEKRPLGRLSFREVAGFLLNLFWTVVVHVIFFGIPIAVVVVLIHFVSKYW